MDEDISIMRIEPMRVASIRSVCDSPEDRGWEVVAGWAARHDTLAGRRVIGFDVPPYADEAGPERGYEYWLELRSGETPEPPMHLRHFEGGLYAVLRVAVAGRPWETIPPAWQRLEHWLRDNSRYVQGAHQAFELYENPGAPLSDLVLQLCCPVIEKAT